MKRSRPATEEKQRIDPNVPEALTRLGLVPCSLQQQIDRLRKDVVDTNHDAAEEQAECSSDEECIGPTGRRIWYVSDPDATCNATFRRALMILRRDVCPGPGMNVSQKQVVVACARAIEETGKSSVWCSKQTKFNNQSKSFGRSQGSSITTNSDIHHFCQAPWTNLLKRIGPLRMMKLLCSSCLFEELENGCAWQLSGSPLHDHRVWTAETRNSLVKQTSPNFGRSRMMYCATFPRKPGLPTNHLVSQVCLEYEKTIGHFDGFPKPKAKSFFLRLLREVSSIIPPYSAARKLYTDLFDIDQSDAWIFLGRRIHVVQEFLNKCDKVFQRPLKRYSPQNSEFSKILNRHCPLPSGWSKCTTADKDHRYANIVDNPVEYAFSGEQAFKFVKALLEKSLPQKLFPTGKSRRNFFSKLFNFLCSGKADTFQSSWLMEACESVYSFPTMTENTDLKRQKVKPNHSVQQTTHIPSIHAQYDMGFISIWYLWLLEHFLIPTIRSNFYVTETGAFRSRCLYYRKPVWALICRLATNRLRDVLNLKEVTSVAFLDRRDGCSPMRLIPKGNGIRPVMNLSSSRVFKFGGRLLGGESGGTNLLLKNPQLLLSRMRRSNPNCLGAAVFGLDDIHVKWAQTLSKLRGNVQPGTVFSQDMPHLSVTMAGVDMKQCYDNIKHDKLLEILDRTFSLNLAKRLPIWRYTTTVPSVRPYSSSRSTSYVLSGRTRFSRVASLHNNLLSLSFPRFVDYVSKGSRNQVFARNPPHHVIETEKAYEILRSHILHHCVTFRGQLFVQRQGIAQGSVVSSILCNLYFGDMENNLVLPSLQKHSEKISRLETTGEKPLTLLLRLTDDYLIVSTSMKIVKKLVNKLHKGSEVYNCRVNPSKTVTSRQLSQPRHGEENDQDVFTDRLTNFSSAGFIGRQTWLPCCGILIGTLTGEVLIDVSRVVKPTRIRDCVTIRFNKTLSPWDVLSSFKSFLRSNCLAILVDMHINSFQIVALNAFQMSLIALLKLICVLRQQRNDLLHENQFVDVLEEGSSYLYALIRQRIVPYLPSEVPGNKEDSTLIVGSEPVGPVSGEISQVTSHKASLVRHQETGSWCDLSRVEVKYILFSASSLLFHGKYSMNCSSPVLKQIDERISILRKYLIGSPQRKEALSTATDKANSTFVNNVALFAD